MVNYRLIIEYHQKGNNNTQVATLCSCSRMTVWKVLDRIKDMEISIEKLLKLDNEKLKNIIFPEYEERRRFSAPRFQMGRVSNAKTSIFTSVMLEKILQTRFETKT